MLIFQYGIIIIIVLIITTFIWYRERYVLKVRKYNVYLPNLPETLAGFTVLHLSDLHGKRFGKCQKKLLHLIRQQQFDLVAITGDLVNKFWPDIDPAVELIQNLPDKPVYFVSGNHEWKTGFRHREKLRELGVQILDNKAEMAGYKDGYIWVLGVDDPHTGRDNLDKALQEAAQESGEPRVPRLLLAHSPNIFPKADDRKIDLILAGHTHGGQVRFPLVGAVFAPGQGLLPRWDYGKYQAEHSTMIISSGLGESDLPIRFNIRPEIVLVSLFPAG
ncbi:metallophosphoesterase [Phosphitispora sp. TUW77]|uniref:metallophosphoesterase n=1 Tax=Phosphitispora sp. TUW77 TaxID=3152361 RepID=UPI003AB5B058